MLFPDVLRPQFYTRLGSRATDQFKTYALQVLANALPSWRQSHSHILIKINDTNDMHYLFSFPACDSASAREPMLGLLILKLIDRLFHKMAKKFV